VQDDRHCCTGEGAEAILTRLTEAGLLLAEGDRVLALPLDARADRIAALCGMPAMPRRPLPAEEHAR
jgi:hypothetical protein